ncbi:MAG: ferric reductase-like transmembrane domain-containing protein [Solirubrobacterales bacterium]|nr:ferric reductase-like transmembrane domain-containing protein [Solirubrobacterales bacterium]
MTAIASAPSAYWYLARGTGVVALVLLTASVVFGILDSLRFQASPRWPRFAIDSLHRDLSLLVIAVLVVHIVTSVLDSFAPIKLIDSVVPFSSAYRPLWLGLGALSFDLLVALVITSLLRRRLGYRAWRSIHWLAYASWPVAVLHGLGTGSDTKVWWSLVLTLLCVVAVSAAAVVRIARTPEAGEGLRTAVLAAALGIPVALAGFTLLGPLRRGWASRSGTPQRLLASLGPTAVASPVRVPPSNDTLRPPFSAQLHGTVSQTPEAGGAVIDLSLRLSGGAHGKLRVRMAGAPLADGGLSMTGSQVALAAPGLHSAMQGQISSLQGQDFVARVHDGSGASWDLHASLSVDNSDQTVSGTLTASQAGA